MLDTDGRFIFPLGEDFDIRTTCNAAPVGDEEKERIQELTLPRCSQLDGFMSCYRLPNVLENGYAPIPICVRIGHVYLEQSRLCYLGSDKDLYYFSLDYELSIVDLAKRCKICDLFPTEEFTYNADWVMAAMENTEDGWQDGDSCIGTALTHYGNWMYQVYGGNIQRTTFTEKKGVAVEDFRPLISTRCILEKAAKKLGLPFKSELYDSDWGRKQWSYLLKKNLWEYDGRGLSYESRSESTNLETFILQSSPALTTEEPPFDLTGYSFHPLQGLTSSYDGSLIYNGVPSVSQNLYFNSGALSTCIELCIEADLRHLFNSNLPSNPDFKLILLLYNQVTGEVIAVSANSITTTAGGVLQTLSVCFNADILPSDSIGFVISGFNADNSNSGFGQFELQGWRLSTKLPADCDKRMYRNDRIRLKQLINPEYTVWDFLQGIKHPSLSMDLTGDSLCVQPEDDVAIFCNTDNEQAIEGYYNGSEDWSGRIDPNSIKDIPPKALVSARYCQWQFNGDGDNFVKSLDLETPIWSRMIDGGEGYPEETENKENPFFEGTGNIQTTNADSPTNYSQYVASSPTLSLPAMWDNDNNEISYDIAPRNLFVCYVEQGHITNYDDPIATQQANAWTFEGQVLREFAWAFNCPASDYGVFGLDFYVDYCYGYGYHPFDLYNLFANQHTLKTYLSSEYNVLAKLDPLEYYCIDKRKKKCFSVDGHTAEFKLLSMSDVSTDPCSPVPITFKNIPTQKYCPDPCESLSVSIIKTTESRLCNYKLGIFDPTTGMFPDTIELLLKDNDTRVYGVYELRVTSDCPSEGNIIDSFPTEVVLREPHLCSSAFLEVGGYLEDITISVTGNTLVAIPLSPTSAVLSGACGTVVATDLIYGASNFDNAVKVVICNFLDTIGYIDGANYILETIDAGGDYLICFACKHNPSGNWLGIDNTQLGSGIITYSTNGTPVIGSNSFIFYYEPPASTQHGYTLCQNMLLQYTTDVQFMIDVPQLSFENIPLLTNLVQPIIDSISVTEIQCSGSVSTLIAKIDGFRCEQPPTYLWSQGSTTESIEVLGSGIYEVKINSCGCEKTAEIEII